MWYFSGDSFEVSHYRTQGGGDENGTGETVWLFSNVTIRRTCVLKGMEFLAPRCGFSVDTDEFPGLGVFVDGIAGRENNEDGNGAYWVYWVDGEYAMKSANEQKLEDGMLVRWKYEAF